MKINYDHRCRCGCQANAHTVGVFTWNRNLDFVTEYATLEEVQKEKWIGGHLGNQCGCERFELPNLDLIEYLAEQRGLI